MPWPHCAAARAMPTSSQEVGAFLFEAIFCGDVAGLLRTSLGMVRAAGKGLRIQLRIEAPELESIPWEYIYDPAEDSRLALSAETALVRHVPLRLPVRPTASKLPLRVLHVIASPSDLEPLDVEREKAIILDALSEWIAQGKVEVTVVERATVATVNEALRRVQPHVFHFSGHGVFDGDSAAIALENDDGTSHAVDDRTFREFFSASSQTRVVVLNACETGVLSSTTPLVGMAPRLLQRQLSAVVAMQAVVTDEASLIFAREFYRSLAQGYPIDAAMAEARKGLYMELGADDMAWGMPVLFLRARDGQLFEFEESVEVGVSIQPPAKADPVPILADFVGRSVELDYYAEQMRSYGSAVICGMAGVGKTALATVLAGRWPNPEKVFWYTFHPGEELSAMLWPLAGFLYWNQQPELWNMLQSVQTAGGQAPPVPVMLDYAVQMLRGQGYLLCYDNIHLINDDPMLRPFVERLRPRLAGGEIACITTSQRVPDYFRAVDQLEGMNEADTSALIQTRWESLDPELVHELHRHTQGNPEFLLIALDALAHATNPSELIERLSKVSDMRSYLLNQLDELLTDDERNIESAVAVLGIPSSRDAIEIVLDVDNLRRALHDLTERYLLTVTQSNWVREYGQHTILQDFYYDYLSRRLRLEFHRRAAEYFELDAVHAVHAARHYWQAGELSKAVQVAVDHVRWAINHYQAHAMADVLDRLSAGELSSTDRIRVDLALGQLQSFLGARDVADRHYRRVLAAPAADEDGHAWRVQAYRGLGQLTYNEHPHAAKSWFLQGLDELSNCRQSERSALEATIQIDLGWALLRLQEFEGAERALMRCLDLFPLHLRNRVSQTLQRLANRHLMEFDLDTAVEYAERAAAESALLSDAWQTQMVRTLLASIKHHTCDRPGAIEVYEEALASAIGLGDLMAQSALHINIGIAQHNLGNAGPSAHHLHAGIELAQRDGLKSFELKAQLELGKLLTQLQAWTDAEAHLSAAESLIQSLGTPDAKAHLPLVQSARAELELAMGRQMEALQTAQRAVAEAEAQGQEVDLAVCQRVEAEVLMAQRRYDDAVQILQPSLALLQGKNPHETAKTQAVFGLALSAADNGDEERLELGRRMLAEATITLTTLGAKLDLEALTAMRSA